jgi:hypothetical protein
MSRILFDLNPMQCIQRTALTIMSIECRQPMLTTQEAAQLSFTITAASPLQPAIPLPQPHIPAQPQRQNTEGGGGAAGGTQGGTQGVKAKAKRGRSGAGRGSGHGDTGGKKAAAPALRRRSSRAHSVAGLHASVIFQLPL